MNSQNVGRNGKRYKKRQRDRTKSDLKKNAKLFVDQMFRLFDRLFDADESGNIELDEMFEIVATFYDMEGEPREPAFEQAEEIFKALDVNGDGSLDEEEFVKLRMEQEYRARVEAEGEKQDTS